MKRMFAIVAILLVILQSCKKENNTTDTLDGNWKLTEVYNNSLQGPKPADAGRDFIITFKNANAFSGALYGPDFLSRLNLVRIQEQNYSVFLLMFFFASEWIPA